MRIVQSPQFKKAYKRLHKNQQHDLEPAILAILGAPDIGVLKIGDLAGARVYKFRMVNQLMLLAYRLSYEGTELELIAVGPHENFYRDIK